MNIAILLVTVLLLSSQITATHAAIDAPSNEVRSTEEKDRVLEQLSRAWSGIDRWLIEYEAVPVASHRDAIPVHKIMAVSAPSDFYHMVAHFPPTNPWQADPFCQELLIHSNIIRQSWRFNRTFSEKPIKTGATIPGTTWMDVLFTIVPRWPLTAYKIPASPISGAPVILCEALNHPDYRLMESGGIVNGEPCAIFDYKGIERIWVATNKGLCFMRRDVRQPTSNRLFSRVIAEQHFEPLPGVWLPSHFRIQYFDSGKSADGHAHEGEHKHGHIHKNDEGLVVDEEISVRILRCAVNSSVPDSTFRFQIPPGALNYTDDSKFSQVAPGGEDLLTQITEFMVKYAKLPTKPAFTLTYVGWSILGFVGGLVVVLIPSNRGTRSKGQMKAGDPSESFQQTR